MDNIAYCVTYPKIPRKDVDSLTIEQIREIIEVPSDEPLKRQICIRWMIATGAWGGETIESKWECVYWNNNTLYLCENRVYTSKSGAISTTLKTGRIDTFRSRSRLWTF